MLDKLIENVEESCEFESKNYDRKKVIENIDILYDYIRSGEEVPEHSMKNLLKVFQQVLDKFGNDWIFISMTSFILKYLYGKFSFEYLFGEEIHLCKSLLNYTFNSKRELRDAASQSLGNLIANYDNEKIFEFGLADFLSMERKSFESVEGLMMTLGYVLKNITLQKQFTQVFDIVVSHSSDISFKSYSSYIRLESLRALNRSLNSTLLTDEMKKKIKEIAFSKLSDENINVRKIASQLLTNVQQSKKLIEELDELKNGNKDKWETLHGICLALSKFDTSALDFSSLKKMIQILDEIIHRDDKDKNSFTVNSIGGQAVVQLFISYYFSVAKLDENLATELSGYYKSDIQPILKFMFHHAEAQVLDGAGSSFNLLLNKLPQIIEKDELMVWLYKNQFHASGPIQNNAKMIWKSGLKAENEVEYLTKLTPTLISHLVERSKNQNFEIRECAFKALDQVLSTTKSQEFDEKEVYQTMKSAINLNQETGKMFDDCSKCASISALGSFIQNQKDKKQNLDEYISIISKLFKDEKDDETILLSCMGLLRSLIENHFDYSISKYEHFISNLLLFIKSDTFGFEVKNISIYLYALIINHVKKNNNWVQKVWNHFVPKDDEEEEEDDEDEFISEIFATTSTELKTHKSTLVVENLGFLKLILKQPNNLNYLKCLNHLISNDSFVQLLEDDEDEVQKILYFLNFSLFGEEEFEPEEDDEYKTSTFKAPSFSFDQLKKLKYIISISVELFKIKQDKEFLDSLSKNLTSYVNDKDYLPYISNFLVILINGKMTNQLIMQMAQALVTEFEVKGKLSNPNEQMIQQCVQVIKNSYGQVPKDKKIILLNNLLSINNLKDHLDSELIYNLCKNEKDIVLLSKLILMLNNVKDQNDHDFMWMLSTLLKQTEIKEVEESIYSSFYVTNLIISLSNWNIDHLKFVFSKNHEKEEKVLFLMYQAMKSGQFTEEMTEFYYDSLKEATDLTSIYQWKLLSLCIDKLHKFDSWDKKIQILMKESKKNLMTKKLILDVCVTYGSIYFVKKDEEFLQLFSNILFDEEIEEEKELLKEYFEMMELRSTMKPLLLPKPIVDKVNFNSTFSQLQ
eukprot:gene11371-4539_t